MKTAGDPSVRRTASGFRRLVGSLRCARYAFSSAWLLVLICVAARLLPALLFTGSEDLGNHYWLARVADIGVNPYDDEVPLNFPPLWISMVVFSLRASDFWGIDFSLLVKGWAIAADCLITLALYSWRWRADESGAFRTGLLWALNPLSIFITAMHGQFDSIPALCLLLAVLTASEADGESDLAAWWLGIGGLIKTWPLFVMPAFLWGRRLKDKIRFVLIAVAPWTVTIGALFVVSPGGVTHKVLEYRGISGWWGTTGIAFLLDLSSPRVETFLKLLFFGAFFTTVLLFAGAREPARSALAMLVCFVALAPGFGPQYLVWFAALAFVVDRRRAWFYSMIAGTVLIAEALMRPYNGTFGSYLSNVTGPLFTKAYGQPIDREITIVARLPIWIYCLYWWGDLVRQRLLELIHRSSEPVRDAQALRRIRP